MKRMKKIASLLLAAVMVFAMGATAFAAKPENGETYTAYKIFDATISADGNTASYSIDKDSEWLTVVQVYNGTGVTLTESADGTKYVVTTTDAFDTTAAAAFAAYLAQNTTGKSVAASGKAENNTVTLAVEDDGYYLITSSLGSTCQLVTGGSITVNEKNTVPDIVKTIDESNKYAQVGDVIPFTITIKDGTGTDKAITLHDQMSEGLTFNSDSLAVKVGETGVEESNYTVGYGQNGDTFTITFTAGYIASLAENTEIVVTYTATLNEKAVTATDPVTNKASIDYSNQTNIDENKVEVKTNSFAVKKYAKDDATKANLAGATFQLKQGDTVIKLVPIAGTDNEYRVAMTDETGAVDSFTTVAGKNIVIKGVDSDLDYTLVETKAPAGYNLLTAPRTFDVSDKNITVVEVENQSGSTLPTTGGMGTTVLYVVGMILVLAAGVLLVVRRRMSASK